MTDDKGNDLPPDPISVMKEGASQLHELFESRIDAGFTEWQACRIIGVYITEVGRQA